MNSLNLNCLATIFYSMPLFTLFILNHLLQESKNLQASYSAPCVPIEPGEHGEWLEIGMSREVLSLALDDGLLNSHCLEEIFKSQLSLYSDHFILFAIIKGQ